MENQVDGLGNSARTAAAFERVKAELFALRAEELQQVSLDITAAFATVMGVLPEVRALRDRLVKELPAFDIAPFDKLEDYALALAFAQSKYRCRRSWLAGTSTSTRAPWAPAVSQGRVLRRRRDFSRSGSWCALPTSAESPQPVAVTRQIPETFFVIGAA